MAITVDEFITAENQAKAELAKSGLRSGFEYTSDGGKPLIWYDQIFQRKITPTGTVTCSNALRVGQTQNSLDVILVASHDNTADLVIAEGASITLKILTADTPDGEYTADGGSICIVAPTDGISAAQDALVARFAIGNPSKLYMKAELAFAGSISGGNIDCGLSFVAR